MEYDQIDKSLDDLRRQHETRTRELKQQRRKHQERLEEIRRLERIKERQLQELREETNFLEGVEPKTTNTPPSSPAPQEKVEETATQPQQRAEEAETVDQPSTPSTPPPPPPPPAPEAASEQPTVEAPVHQPSDASQNGRPNWGKRFSTRIQRDSSAMKLIVALFVGFIGLWAYNAWVVENLDRVFWAGHGLVQFAIFGLVAYAAWEFLRDFTGGFRDGFRRGQRNKRAAVSSPD